jgi:hypothetical protein
MPTDRAASLQAHFSSATKEPRPILTSLNGDNSWLISFPRPAAERQSVGKAYFHAVHDPWLKGSVSALSPWLVHIDLAAPASVEDGDGVEAVAREIEAAAAAAGLVSPEDSKPTGHSSSIDAIFINVDAIDHAHEPTLRSFDGSIPVFAAPGAAKKIAGWGHFDTVVANKELAPEDGYWKNLHPGAPLPEWLTIFHMKGVHHLNFASAMIWSPYPGTYEALLYTPHGIDINLPSMRTLLHETKPDIKVLGILHGLKESWSFGYKNTLGVQYGLPLYRAAKAKYWVISHNSPLKYSGLVMTLGRVADVFRTTEWGLSQEKEQEKSDLERESVNFVEVENGSFTVLT